MKDPIIRGQFSPLGTLALFSPHFASPQPDWPFRTTATGFVFYDHRGNGFGNTADSGMDRRLVQFLDAGPAPILFTLGSSAVMRPGRFYEESLRAVELLNCRAVMLVGMAERNQLSPSLPDSVYIGDYAPYSELMPRCAAIVHQGGIGTTAQALRSGRPMLVVPWGHDQPDNAERIRRLGVGGVLPRKRYAGATAANELKRLLASAAIASRAAEMGEAIRSENGVAAVCDAVEAALAENVGIR